MASDPRFDVFPDQYTETQQRRSKWTSCLIGCLVVLGVVMILVIVAGVWIGRNLRGWVSDFGTQAVNQAINASELPPQEKVEVKAQVERVGNAFRNGEISVEQAGQIMEKVAESPLMSTIIVIGVDAQYMAGSKLSDDEKTQGRLALKRFAQGSTNGKIKKPGIDAVMAYVADRQPNGQWRLHQQVSDADLRAALAEAKSQADAAGIEESPAEVDPSDEFKRIIDEAMQAPAG